MILEMLIWFILLELISFISLPLTFVLFSSLKDRGYGISKILGIFVLSFVSWYSSFLIGYEKSIIISIIIFTSVNFFIAKKVNIIFDKKIVNKIELIFLLSFIIFCLIRSLTPAVEGLEKLFDISLINGILKSEKMPPQDPWFSGHNINYYYFGHFTVATLTKMSHLESTITFNLFLATIYSLLAVGIFTICYSITNSIKISYIGIFLFIFLSNLLGFLQIFTFVNPKLVEVFSKNFNIEYAMTCCHKPDQNFFSFLFTFPVWSSTRVIPNTINEFPFANLMFGEVHSHIISLPIQILAISLFLAIFMMKKYEKNHVAFVALVLTMLYITNSWDFPVYFSLFITVVFIVFFEKRISKSYLFYTIIGTFLLFMLFSLPYSITVSKFTKIGFSNEKSNIFHELILFPIFIFSIYYYYLKVEKNLKIKIFVFIFSILIYVLSGIPLTFLIFPIAFFSLKRLILDNKNRFAHIMTLFGALVMLLPEIFFIDSRYNTVFKFYYHIWIFWSISSVFVIYNMRNDRIFMLILILLIILCLPMTIFSFIDRLNYGINSGVSLDGLSYMREYHIEDYKLIEWAKNNIKNNEIILEASGDAFSYTSIFSSYTGLQTLVGWNNHVGIHHGIWPEERMKDIRIIYETNNETLSNDLINKYNIKYIFYGSVEKRKYPNANLTKFGNPIYFYEDSFIFKVKQ